MSGIIVIAGEPGSDAVARVKRTQAEAGFRACLERRVGDWTLIALSPLADHMPACHFEREDGTFIACAGTLFYRGMTGAPALQRVLSDREQGTFEIEKTVGHFTLIVGDENHANLFCDPLSSYRIYHDPAKTIFSTLFLSVLEVCPTLSVDPQGMYEFVWFEAPHGRRTMFSEISAIPHSTMLSFHGNGVEQQAAAEPDWYHPNLAGQSSQDIVDYFAARLRDVLEPATTTVGDRINMALSGGYDSRLCLAGLRHLGVQPHLYVYGAPDNPDRVSAVAIAKKLGLEIEDWEKPSAVQVAADDYAAHIAANTVVFDGWKITGIFDNAVDLADRQKRMSKVDLLLLGGGGEVLRNFFYLRPGRYTLGQVVSTFYSSFDPAACTNAFDEGRFRRAVMEQIAEDLKVDPARPLEREWVEAVYPLYRVRYWTSRDQVLNQRFGSALYPFVCPQFIQGSPTIPISLKSYGVLEARLIKAIDPELAAFRSGYGFAFDRDPPFHYRLLMQGTYLRPAWSRRYSYRIQAVVKKRRPQFLSEAYLGRVVDPDLPVMSEFFQPSRIADPDVYSRVATVEYLLGWHAQRRRNTSEQ